MMNCASNGRFKHFGYPINGGVKEGDSFTQCESCGVRLWKDTRMDTVHCSSCGLELKTNHGSVSYPLQGGGSTSETPLRSKTRKSRLKYENSGVIRLYGGHRAAYDDDEDYSFAELDDTLIDETF